MNIKVHIIKLFFTLLKGVNYIIPKDNNLWVFGGRIGEQYADNSKYLFEYMSDNTEHTVIWMTKDKKVYNLIMHDGRKVVFFYSVQGLYYAMRARYLIFCVSYNDLSIFALLFAKKSFIINLWHGIPLKKIFIKRSANSQLIRTSLTAFLGREHDFVIFPNQFVIDTFSDYFSPLKNNFLKTTYPRNDGLLLQERHPLLKKIAKAISFKKVLFYLPTFREYTFDNLNFDLFSATCFNQKKIELQLEEMDAILLLKMHPRDIQRMGHNTSLLTNSKRIIFVEDKDIHWDIYPLLAHTDILITDYSSVCIDVLNIDMPLIFLSFDKERYAREDRGFAFDYNSVTAGPQVNNWVEVMAEAKVYLNKKDKYAVKRKEVSAKLNKYTGSNNSEQTYLDILNKTVC